MCAFENPTKPMGASRTFTPPATAAGTFPSATARHAISNATNADEHAVSTVIEVP